MPVVDTKFELCRDVEYVLKIGRDYQNKDGFRGAHYDTVKLLCDTIEYLRDKLPKPDPDWKAICKKCHDGEIEPKCEYYGEPNGCNSPIYGEHPKASLGNNPAMREALATVIKIAAEMRGEYEIADSILKDGWATQLESIAKAALSIPPRNCDVGTVEEQAKRKTKFCYQPGGCSNCSFSKSATLTQCALAWAQMPYEAQKGGEE